MHVAFSDDTEEKIIAVFGCLQDFDAFPYQGEVEEDDPRLIDFYDVKSTVSDK